MTATTRTAFVSRAPRLGFVPGFDGIRGLGIAVVLYEHSLADSVLGIYSFGPIVDLFFVLSGFLIVTLLLQEHRSNDTIALRKFYARRALRLLPSVWLYLVVVIAFAAVFARELLGEVLKDAAAAFFYVYNLFYPPGTTIFRPDIVAQRSMSQLWTLSLEEQFYVIIGVVILVAVTRRWVKALMVAAVGLALLAQWGRATGHYGPFMIAMQRPDALLLGSALALVNAHWEAFDERRRRLLKRVASVGVVIGALALFTSAHPFARLGLPYWEGYPERFATYTADVATLGGRTSETYVAGTEPPGTVYFIQFGHTIVIWASLPFVLAMARVKDWRMNRFLQWKPFMYMGRLSYSLYIWHGIGIWLAFGLMGDATGLFEITLRSALVWVVSFAFAIPVYQFVELRFQKIKLGFSAEKTTVDVATGKEIDVSTGKTLKDTDSEDSNAGDPRN